jgi:hypothetical protein
VRIAYHIDIFAWSDIESRVRPTRRHQITPNIARTRAGPNFQEIADRHRRDALQECLEELMSFLGMNLPQTDVRDCGDSAARMRQQQRRVL